MNNTNLEWLPNPVILYNEKWEIAWMNSSAKQALGYKTKTLPANKDIYSITSNIEQDDINLIVNELKSNNPQPIIKRIYHIHASGHAITFDSNFGKIHPDSSQETFYYIQSAIVSDSFPSNMGHEQLTPGNFSILAKNLPGLEMFLVDKNLQVHCRMGSESHKQGWVKDSVTSPLLTEYFPAKQKDMILSLAKIVFEETPVSTEFHSENHHFSIRMFPLNEKDKTHKCVVILQNITDAKRVQEQLRQSKEKAEDASDAKDRFVAKMSHEIRTPLNAVIGFSDQLHQTRLTKKQSDYLTIIDNASHHLLSIIDDILVLSKIEAEKIEIEHNPFNLQEVFDSVSQVLRHKHKEKGLDFYIHAEDTLHERTFSGDAPKLRQILINLGGNAIKFTRKGNVSIRCFPVKQTQSTQDICFEVSDTGIGISEEEITRIFQPFHQVDNRIDRSFTGCGLGLAISKELLEAMDSKLQVKSTPGKGSKFFFTLSFEKNYPTLPKRSKPILSSRNKKAGKILFVDDDPLNRTLGSIILKKHNIKSDFAASGAEALKKFRPGKYQVIFLDINMPEMNGMEVLNSIRNKEKKNPHKPISRVIAMTANTVRKQIREYLKAGMDSVILKPYKEEALIKHIFAYTSGLDLQEDVPAKNGQQELSGKEMSSYDLSQLRQITRGDTEFMMLMLNSFIENGQQMQEKIKEGLLNEDYGSIAEAAHRLHPSMEQLGVAKATKLLKKIDKKYLRKESFAPDAELINNALEEIDKSLLAIRTALKDL